MMEQKSASIRNILYLICLSHLKLILCQNVTDNTSFGGKEELDWNLYELEKQQVLDYNDLKDHKDGILKEIDLLEKRAKAEEDLEDKFLYLYHDLLKRETLRKQQQYTTIRRRKKRSSRDRNVIKEQTIDGGWSPWSNVATPCNATCGGGKMIKRRSCTNPTPQGHRPKMCAGKSYMYFDCATEPCHNQWSDWSSCSAYCGRGTRRRVTMCALSPVLTNENQLKRCKDVGLKHQDFEHIEECNTWDKKKCPSACEGYNCPEFALCRDISTKDDPMTTCECQLSRVMSEDGEACIIPELTPPPPPPDPTIPAEIKVIVIATEKSSATILILCLVLTLFLFCIMRVYTIVRVIQMNMEISLILANAFAVVIPNFSEYEQLCRIVSILTHYFYTVCFFFMMLEALHCYSILAYVVRKGGLLTKAQNVIVGWVGSAAIVLIVCSKCFEEYGGDYHCWLQLDKMIIYGQITPIVLLWFVTFTLIEAAGQATDYRKLPGIIETEITSAQVCRRGLSIISILAFISFVFGVVGTHNQDVAVLGIFTILNGILGCLIFLVHCNGNEEVRERIMKFFKKSAT